MAEAIRKDTTVRTKQFARSVFVLSLALGLVVIAYLGIRAVGGTLHAPTAATEAIRSTSPAFNVVPHLMLALVLVISVARALGALCHYFKQPPVIGEIVAGITLGPSILGHVAPEMSGYLFPTEVTPFLNAISQLGVILYMFLVGLRLDTAILKVRGRAAVSISQCSIATPFLFGALLALLLYPKLSTSDVSFTSFSLFLGVSMSVTAFPVLARILTDRGIQTSGLGMMALTCAAIGDVSAWCLLALVVGIVQGHTTGAASTIAMALLFIAVLAVAVKPLLARIAAVHERTGLTQGMLSLLLVAALVSALVTDRIGIHAIFGAFALGVVIPHDSKLVSDLTHRLQDWVVVLLLPAFFAFTGLRTQIGLLGDWEAWGLCGLVTLVATIGKFSGSAIAARVSGANWRESSAIGILMNTRGLMELIVLNIGFELKIISPELFTMLVIMALLTTCMTAPILSLIMRRGDLSASD